MSRSLRESIGLVDTTNFDPEPDRSRIAAINEIADLVAFLGARLKCRANRQKALRLEAGGPLDIGRGERI